MGYYGFHKRQIIILNTAIDDVILVDELLLSYFEVSLLGATLG
jgi:hypothetical protein